MISPWTEQQRATLRAFCDTVFPELSIQPDPHGFWRRRASDFGVDSAFIDALDAPNSGAEARSGTQKMLDVFASCGFIAASSEARERLLHDIAASSPDADVGVRSMIRGVLGLCYTVTDPLGRNPNWPVIDYPGPPAASAACERPIEPFAISGDELSLSADVCVVGSGAGGGVIAGELAERGLDVIVLEAGGYFAESDFNQLELWSYRNLYWRGGQVLSADGTIRVLAGSALGGGTLVNWENCVRPPEWVRQEWERVHRLDGLAGAEFDACLQRVLTRIGANADCSDFNGPHQRLEAGATRLGYRFERALRNVDRARYDANSAGFHGFGDVTGSRQSVTNTYLQSAHASGTRILCGTRAERILSEAGRACGVEAIALRPDGGRTRVHVRARTVVVAGGALETPALLLRSGIGGPAAGRYLRLHPCVALIGRYAEDQRSWWGPPQAALCDQFLRAREDHGFLIEGAHHGLSLLAPALPWHSGRQHKALMSESSRCALLIAIVRDRGHGSVGIAADGSSVIHYPVSDALDLANIEHACAELARLHEAAGASVIYGGARAKSFEWQRGEDLTAWLTNLRAAPGASNSQSLFSAHQMGSARMGYDPDSSACNPDGELHDLRGVWIGDTSAFPSAPGVNPMITCMALATRTAARIGR